ncbi:hypothetical protein yc1106_09573 [Curvularia clavata]|uniref:Uncharacterized protein n=1 Tax=Curvularia clavata TaxID=95742 RepID=A0A9Q9DXT9_CURCL|nr:hypothetical protein yc1106_09573 [Curvularia clavata]
MAFSASPLKTMLFALLLLSTSTIAQNMSNTSNMTSSSDGCDNENNHDIPKNASGTVQTDNLYISVTLGDYRNETSRLGTFKAWRYGYLSAPKNSTAQACVYIFDAIPDAKEGDQLDGCSGVLSTQCIDYLERSWQLSNTTGSAEEELSCPSFNTQSSDFKDACGSSNLNGYISKAINTANTTCALSLPPNNMNWGLPSDYETYPVAGALVSPYDSRADEFKYYEIYAKQPVPFVIADVNMGKAQTRVVCVAPDKAMNGSHEVMDTKSTGAQMEMKNAGWITMLMALLVAALLV